MGGEAVRGNRIYEFEENAPASFLLIFGSGSAEFLGITLLKRKMFR